MSGHNQPSWPTMTEYQEAIQSPKLCFDRKELRKGKPVLNKLGLPRPVCGQFASVYELETPRSKWAIKCFLRNTPDLHSRYAKIAEHLGTVALPYFVNFDYVEEGIRIRGHFFPIVTMEWVDGLPLNQYVEKNLADPGALKQLERRWVTLLGDLRSVNVAHADLQHGNVLVAPEGSLRLIDYDGMWVPQLQGQGSHEIGHPDYQCPLRTGRDFDADTDRFAGEVILIALRALAKRPDLWDRYDNGENLLFKRFDFVKPDDSELFRDLRSLGDDEINPRLDDLARACGGKPGSGGPFERRPKHASLNAPSGNVVKAADAGRLGGTRSAATKTITLPRPARVAGRTAPRPGTAVAAPTTSATVSTTRAPAPAVPAVTVRTTPVPEHGPFLGFVRVMLHLILMTAASFAAMTEFPALLGGGDGDSATRLLGLAFCSVPVLGVLSLVTLFGRQPAHIRFHNLFCFSAAVLIVFIIFSQLIVGEWSHWTGDDGLQCLVMLAMLVTGTTGLFVERTWCRRGT